MAQHSDCPSCRCIPGEDPTTARLAVRRTKARVIKYLIKHGPTTLGALRRDGFRSDERVWVHSAVSQLRQEGLVVYRGADGRWDVKESLRWS